MKKPELKKLPVFTRLTPRRCFPWEKERGRIIQAPKFSGTQGAPQPTPKHDLLGLYKRRKENFPAQTTTTTTSRTMYTVRHEPLRVRRPCCRAPPRSRQAVRGATAASGSGEAVRLLPFPDAQEQFSLTHWNEALDALRRSARLRCGRDESEVYAIAPYVLS